MIPADTNVILIVLPEQFHLKREKDTNFFQLLKSQNNSSFQSVPLIPVESLILAILRDSLNESRFGNYVHPDIRPANQISKLKTIYSQPTDSVLKPVMHRSDNFFAEQSLLMVSNERHGKMNDEKIIDALLKAGIKDLSKNRDG